MSIHMSEIARELKERSNLKAKQVVKKYRKCGPEIKQGELSFRCRRLSGKRLGRVSKDMAFGCLIPTVFCET